MEKQEENNGRIENIQFSFIFVWLRDEKSFYSVKKKNEIIENKFGRNLLLLNQTKLTLKETSEKKEKEKKEITSWTRLGEQQRGKDKK